MTFENNLQQHLTQNLPGSLAHAELVPRDVSVGNRLKPPPSTAKQSAVVVPLIVRNEMLPDVMFTLRSETLSTHRGQISFPGGRIDAGETAQQAALRELNEETGVEPTDVIVLGALTPLYIPPSNSAVTPFVALLREPNEYTISEAEVEEIFHVPLTTFLDEGALKLQPRAMFGKMLDVPFWDVGKSVPLWGATAMILNELLWLARKSI